MGYPMTWLRLVHRNHLYGDYENDKPTSNICGDMRRLESDSQDERHLAMYAEVAGITPEQAGKVIEFFFKSRRMGEVGR